MTSRFDSYGTTPVGIQLANIITMPEMIPEYCALSRVGKPAVQAIAADVTPILEGLSTKEERDAANQFVGWRVAQVMRGLGYHLIQERGRVTGAPYRTGAVWSYEPGQVKVGFSVPEGITRTVDVVVKETDDGEVVADIDAKAAGSGAVHRVRTALRVGVPFDEAIEFAKGYAARHGYGYVHVRDVGRHLPADALQKLIS